MSHLKSHLVDLLSDALRVVASDTPVGIEVLPTRQATHGDFACNVAMQLAKVLARNPREVARDIVDALPLSPWLEKVEIAGAGFINFFFNQAAKQRIVPLILARGEAFGRAQPKGIKVQVEFVSANPTGPLHVGHGRGAAYGASLANVLAAAGYDVTREFYVNDAGRQMDILALSTWLRYLELNGINVPFPPNAYQGEYVRDMARVIYAQHGDRYVHEPWHVLDGAPSAEADPEGHLDQLIANAKKLLGEDYAYVHDLALTEQLGDCRNDLTEFGVVFDNWFSEKSLYESGLVARAIELLQSRGHLYRQDGALWFRSTAFGDEKDRVVQRENGQYTYFASDIAYHLNKFERGFDRVIDVWGADHHGYVARVKGALTALGLDAERLTVALVQFAVLYRGKERVPMSTRAGEFVTLRQLRNEVGNDAARFFYVLRKSDQHLDFDLELAKAQSNENPVYYIQYAHARAVSVLTRWGGDLALLSDADVSRLTSTHELALAKRLDAYPETVETAARELAPHHIAYYLRDLAGDFHTYYNAEQFLVEDEAVRLARLALVAAARQVFANGLGLLGVSAPAKM
ncbi:arginine--tRNA ligase [Thiobacter aerophilum]|uniref:Arginine--tRNA ligase n=1 Tax=Thiobacter aerophilum TaxID=3121275 RepID=A0ABV0EDJ9_9BURK